MKIFKAFVLFGFCLLNILSCRNSAETSKETAIELMTSQTLGLAYLEEFKLEEAEIEFLKFIKLAKDDKLGYANLGLVYLRMGKYVEAEKQLLKAKKIDSKDPDIRLLIATVYQMSNKRDKAILELKEALEFAPDHVKVLYMLSELYSTGSDVNFLKQRKNYILRLVEKAPSNLVPNLIVTELFIGDSEFDNAIKRLEIIQEQFPEFPKEAIGYFDETLSLLEKSDKGNAIVKFMMFHNYMKVTSPYQAGIIELKGPGGSLIGFPIITSNQQTSTGFEEQSLLDVIEFTEVAASAGLNIVALKNADVNSELGISTHIECGDYDGDGDMDIYVGSFDPASSETKSYLFNNHMSRFEDIAEDVGIKHSGKESSAIFTDYDNDGFLDLYVVREDGDLLYRNIKKGEFKDISEEAGIRSKNGGSKVLFLDLDHDGDLDLFKARSTSNIVFRNNGDGTFLEQTNKMELSGDNKNSKDAAFGDFDDDGDIDLFVINDGAPNNLYSNQRQGMFNDISESSGIESITGNNSVAVADYNNDGFLDFFITSTSGENNGLFRNQGNGKFKLIDNSNEIFSSLNNVKANDVNFFDFDNDGYLDILVAGESIDKGGRGIFLFHNDGVDKFSDVSELLPDEPRSGKQIVLFDYNDDGDQDILIAGLNGQVYLLRNDGGNMNHYVDMKLVGLRTGSAKNNFFGIGAKVEMRSGDLYQTMVVTKPEIHFGIGSRTNIDVIRITWTNGVPQNIFQPNADQDVIEAQTLKGSCPFLYTWNGEKYVFVKDITWRSALGMPLGIMGGTTKYAFADASDDYIKIPGELLKSKNGEYSIQVTSELWETIYMDKIRLAVVDHPDSVDIFVPEQFSPPPFPGCDIFTVNKKYFPVSAKDTKGNDVLSFILEKDDNYLAGFRSDKFQGTTELHDLILDPGEAGKLDSIYVFLNGWIFPTDASINVALSQSNVLSLSFPIIQVINKKGEWETVLDNLGFPMGKDKTVIADLSGKFLSADRRIRIRTNMEIYWDEIFFSDCSSNVPVVSTMLNPSSANLHYRGFSRTYRKGENGPHWFDYYDVDQNKKWRDLTGNYTRYGDVLPLLKESDNKYIISNAGDEMSINFDSRRLPKLKSGWKRDFLIHSVGWVKDGDMNTAFGDKVLPLPFHGMKSYPPSKSDIYPNDPELMNYIKNYNTRTVTMDDFRQSFSSRDY